MNMTERDLQKIKLKHLKENIVEYNNNLELIKLYDDYIQKLTELFDFLLGKNDDLFYTIVFNILFEIGFFSHNNTFDDSMDNFKELSIKLGISVVNGAGVCRNISCFYEDIFKNIFNYPLSLCCFNKISDSDKDNDAKIYSNHMINLSKYQDVIYGFDLINHSLFKPIDKNKLKCLDTNFYLYHKAMGDLLINVTTGLTLKDNFLNELKLKKQLLMISSRADTITKEKYQKLILDANNFIVGHKKIFKSFLEDSTKYKDEIKEKMLLLK